MMSLVFVHRAVVRLVGMEKTVKLNVKRGNGALIVKMIVVTASMEPRVIE